MSGSAPIQSLIVFSHLRWNFVFQRPQHLLSRLARRYRIHLFEEPIPGQAAEHLEVSTPAANVRVYRMHSTSANAGFHDDQIPMLQRMVMTAIKMERIEDYAVW